VDIFDGVCQNVVFHPARDFQTIVRNAVGLVLAPKQTDLLDAPPELDDVALQSLLDLMNDSGLEWPGNWFDSGPEVFAGWDPNV
jgi:hypothetical protein